MKWNISVTRIAFSPLLNVLGLISVLFLYPGKTFFLLITKARYLASYGFNIQIIRHFHTKKTKLFFLSYKVIDIIIKNNYNNDSNLKEKGVISAEISEKTPTGRQST